MQRRDIDAEVQLACDCIKNRNAGRCFCLNILDQRVREQRDPDIFTQVNIRIRVAELY